MDVVRDGDEDNAQHVQDDGETRRYPTRLRGRGGFGRGQGTGRAIGRGDPQASPPRKTMPATRTADPMDSLASSMSALKFVPHSVRVARHRGRGTVV